MVDMKDEFIYLPRNVGEMNRLERDYREVGLPGTCGSVDVVHIINHTKGKKGYPTLRISVLPILIGELLASTARHLDHAMTRTLSRPIPT